jgi:hypothetical protein
VFTIPDLWWEAQHGWATITMTENLNQENGGLGNVHNWISGQLVMVSLALIWVWIAGLLFLWRSGRPLWRGLAWAYGLLFVFFMVTTSAKIYYLAGAYVYLLAAGAMQIDGWLAARPGRLRNLLIATGITTAVALPLTLPVLPASDIGWTYSVNQAPRPGRRHTVEHGADTQPGVGRPRLHLHRPAPPLGPAMATIAPLRLTAVTLGLWAGWGPERYQAS